MDLCSTGNVSFFQRLKIHITSCTSYTWKGSSQAEPAIKERANYLDMAKLRVILSSLARKKFKLPQLPFFADILFLIGGGVLSAHKNCQIYKWTHK